MLDLKAQYGRLYRVALDESADVDTARADRPWFYRIACRRGHVYLHGPETLGAYTDRKRIAKRLVALPGVRVHQRGDTEATVVFAPEALGPVLELLQVRRRPVLSEARRAELAARMSAIRPKAKPTFPQ
jgi:hypothetical protein